MMRSPAYRQSLTRKYASVENMLSLICSVNTFSYTKSQIICFLLTSTLIFFPNTCLINNTNFNTEKSTYYMITTFV